MHIAAIGNYWYPERGGGLDRYFHGLTQSLASAGDTVDYFVTSDAPLSTESLRPHTLGNLRATLPDRMMQAFQKFRALERSSLDIVNVHFALNFSPMLPLIPRHKPVLMHFHGPWALESAAEGESGVKVALKYQLERFVLHRAGTFVTASLAFADLLHRTYGIKRERISTIPLAVDTDFFHPMERSIARARLGWDPSDFIVFTARRLVSRVGVGELLNAALELREQPGLGVKIAGRGPLSDEFQSTIQNQGLQNVELLGYVSDDTLRLAYNAADLVIVPTQQLEGFGLIVAEALACGTPVMATPVGGMVELISPLSRSLITADATASAMATTLRNVMDAREELPSRSACRNYALEEFSWPQHLIRVRRLLQSLVS